MAIGHADFARECADRKSSLSQEMWHLLYERAICARSMHGRSIGWLADALLTLWMEGSAT
jgi:hypothetical protein